MLLQIKRIVWKDLKLEIRNLSELGSAVIFSVAASSLLGFALSRIPIESSLFLLGTGLMLIALFLATFTSAMTVVKEDDLGTLDGIKLSPIKSLIFFFGKLILNLILMEVLISTSFVITLLFSGGLLEDPFYIYLLAISSSMYLSVISALSSTISVFLRARGVLMPTIILVLSLPVIQETLYFLSTEEYSGVIMIVLSSFLFFTIASWLARYLLEV